MKRAKWPYILVALEYVKWNTIHVGTETMIVLGCTGVARSLPTAAPVKNLNTIRALAGRAISGRCLI